MPRLSVLDLSPVTGDATPAQAVRDTLEVARAAERLGYHRFWVAEHHNIKALGSPNPEILIAALSQVTSRIRLGSGGVMLVNYSPLKVAETFMELEALAPGRIDLGMGRALGADARTGGALRSVGSEAFPKYLSLLEAWLLDASGKLPIGEKFDIFARAGAARTDFNGPGTGGSDSGFAYGAGADFYFTQHDGIRADWTRHDYNDLDSYSVSYVRKF